MNRIETVFYSIVFTLSVSIQSCNMENKTIESPTAHSDSAHENYYREQFRNQFHFSPEANWMNDPNGMVYYDGEYHLFYQYYPDSTVWGPMHWAHAVSEDLIHWEHLPIALYPDSLGYIFSGSAVIDKENTAGFGKDAMVAIFTYHDAVAEKSGTSNTYQYQAIAYSTDRGRTFIKYEGNPVIPNPGIKDFRDPKVIWDEGSDQWVMVFAAYDHVKFYGSANLREWTHLSDWGLEYGEHGGVWECPDLFPLKVKGSDETRWVLLQSLNPGAPNGGSGTQYFVGDFDGKNFILDPTFIDDVSDGKSLWIDYGTDNYAGVTWSNAPVNNEERLFIGWMSNWQYAQVVPSVKWRSAMTIPRTISLQKEDGKFRLRSQPVEQMSKLEGRSFDIEANKYSTNAILTNSETGSLLKLEMKVKKPESQPLHLKISNDKGEYTVVGYDPKNSNYFIDRTKSGRMDFEKGFGKVHTAPVDYKISELDLTLFIDHASIEFFADEGRVVMTDIVFPESPYTKIELMADDSEIELLQGRITALKRIW